MNKRQMLTKRAFDLALSAFGLLAFGWLILLAWVMSTIDTKMNGFFVQTRIGRHGKPFKVIKIRTMRPIEHVTTTITTDEDPRISAIGGILRKFKLDELPQLLNVFIGQMSFVGPRPDVPGYADALKGNDRKILELRPGITGPASIKFKNESAILAQVEDPIRYNDEIIWPEKVRLNLDYIRKYRLSKDLVYIWLTISGGEISEAL